MMPDLLDHSRQNQHHVQRTAAFFTVNNCTKLQLQCKLHSHHNAHHRSRSTAPVQKSGPLWIHLTAEWPGLPEDWWSVFGTTRSSAEALWYDVVPHHLVWGTKFGERAPMWRMENMTPLPVENGEHDPSPQPWKITTKVRLPYGTSHNYLFFPLIFAVISKSESD